MRDTKPSTSAQTVAMCRAVLTAMGVVDDPFATSMLHRPQRVLARCFGYPPFTRLARSPTFSFLAARTRFFDDAVTSALDDGIEQVAIIGAGYDSRAWRLARPGVRFFEVDHPATQRDKRCYAPHGGPTFVAADLQVDRLTALLPAAGFESSMPSVVIIEGLTMYLPESDVRTVLTDLATLSPSGSRLAVNFTVRGGGSNSPVSAAIARTTRAIWRARGEPTHGWVRPQTISDVVLATGWKAREMVPAPQLGGRYLSGSGLELDGLNPGAICVGADRASDGNPCSDG